MKLLIVDDEVKFLGLLKGYFEVKGYEVWGAESGEEALSLIQQHQPEVILLDLKLKGKLHGQDVLPEAKRLSPKTQVVIITGDDDSRKESMMKLGAAAVVRKPLQLDELDQLVQRLGGSVPP